MSSWQHRWLRYLMTLQASLVVAHVDRKAAHLILRTVVHQTVPCFLKIDSHEVAALHQQVGIPDGGALQAPLFDPRGVPGGGSVKFGQQRRLLIA